MLPYNQLSGEKVTISQFKGEILLYSQFSEIGLPFNTSKCIWKRLLLLVIRFMADLLRKYRGQL